MNNKCCYVTLLGTDNYVYGVLGLWRSLQNNKVKYPFKVIVPENINNETTQILDDFNIEYVRCTNYTAVSEDRWKCCFNKFHFVEWEEFDKIMFLDADIIVIKNPDELFNFNIPAAVITKPEKMQVYFGDGTFVKTLNSMGSAFILRTEKRLFNKIITQAYEQKLECDEGIINQILKKYYDFSFFQEYPYFWHNTTETTNYHLNKYWFDFKLDSFNKLFDFVDTVENKLSIINNDSYKEWFLTYEDR